MPIPSLIVFPEGCSNRLGFFADNIGLKRRGPRHCVLSMRSRSSGPRTTQGTLGRSSDGLTTMLEALNPGLLASNESDAMVSSPKQRHPSYLLVPRVLQMRPPPPRESKTPPPLTPFPVDFNRSSAVPYPPTARTSSFIYLLYSQASFRT
jgi:hypothetical protein